ncbi:MAG: hypothetical protein K2X02_04390 [Alphaproteobacteria bacterium]|nr:hypothetical protein [Alphaproteobacteria bacterium]
MSPFKINVLKLLKSTAMTLLFIPGVSAMVEGWEDPSLFVQSSSSGGRASTSSSIEFEQTPEEKTATKIRSQLNLGEPNKLFLFEQGGDFHYFIKGEALSDGTCFLHTLNMLFPDKGISRDEFAIRLSAAFRGESSSVSSEELRKEFAAELYTQLYELKTRKVALGFEGKEINELSAHLLNDVPNEYFGDPEIVNATMQSIASNDQIIKEMLVAYAQTDVMLSFPVADLGNKGSFGLVCELFGLNLDIYAPVHDKPNSLYYRQEFRFGGASLPKAVFYAHDHVSPLCLEEDLRARRRFAWNDLDVAIRTYKKNASQSNPLSFLKEIGVNPLNVPYLSNRFKVGNTLQYSMNMPQAPIIHPYNIGIDYPLFPYAARLNAGELDPNLFPALSEAQATLISLGVDPGVADYFYVAQNAPWSESRPRFLQPQSWAFPDAPYSSEGPYWKDAKINVAISSPNNAITLASSSEGVIISHNFVTRETPNGDSRVVSSGPTFPILAGFKEDQTNFFVSTVVIPATKRAAVTFHTILGNSDLDLLQRAGIETLPELQNWLANLFQNKYGATSDRSSPYSNWTTRAGSSSSSSSSTPASSSAPAVEPVLLESTPRYHMGKVSPYPLSGFSAPEGAHRWSVGKKASITLPLAEMGFPSQISFFDTRALVTGSHPQNLIVKVNGNEVKRYIYTLEDNNKRIDIPLPEAGPATIEFEMPDAASPSDLGIGADKRALGISFREFQAYSTPRFHMGKVSPYPLSGFSALESSHRWTVGKKATITLPLEVMAHRPSSISFLNTKGFITGSRPQNLIVKVNGGIVKHYVYTPGNNNQTLEIPLPKDGPAIIEFEMPDAASPSDLGIGADKRELGISFGEVKLQ